MVDFLTHAAGELFGLSFLFPYQRLVITNILEAARAFGIKINLPGEGPACFDAGDEEDCISDRGSFNRQIVILPTGAGKSLCFQLPAMLMEGPTLVIYPILGLMSDQERRLAERGFSPVVLRGSQSSEERETIWKKLKERQSKFIIANPEVLLSPKVLACLKEVGIIHIVIDEAHCVSEWGETFRPAYLEINKIINAANAPLVTAFTATAGASVLEKIEKHIFGGSACRILGNPDRKNISYAAKGCILRNLAVRDLVLENRRPAIVFCSSRSGTEYLARYLRCETAALSLPWQEEIRFYHAGLSREEKSETGEWFLQNSEAVLCATCAFGLGIDKADIRTVIHRDCPPSAEAYLQESGRAGRDGKASRAILLWGPDDKSRLSRIRNKVDKNRINILFEYARDTTHCRREALLKLLDYEGETDTPGDSCCDVCDAGQTGSEKQSGREKRGGTGKLSALREEASISDFFSRNRRCYTPEEASSRLARAEELRWSEEDAKEAINYFLKAGQLRKLHNPLWKDKLDTTKKKK